MKHIKTQQELNEVPENLNISGIISSKILCRTCAAYGGCKLDKKGTATKCRNFWEHLPTSDFIK